MTLHKLIGICALLTGSFHPVHAQDAWPAVSAGRIERISLFPSRHVMPRNIDVWLPEGYSDSMKYPVLYMQDGQMLFDPEGSWNKQAWDIDDIATSLSRSGKIRPFIVVGIWNSGAGRHPDYFPQKPYEGMTKKNRDSLTAQLQRAGRTREKFRPLSDHYLKFIVEELKPHIDNRYSVLRDREHTFISGSSMGGLISLYAICEYPEIFGGAACLSTHWPGSFTLDHNPFPKAMLNYLKIKLPEPASHKLYFDCGDQTLDALYSAIQQKADRILKARGYKNNNWLTLYFPGEDHSEKAWKKRLDRPLVFLFGL